MTDAALAPPSALVELRRAGQEDLGLWIKAVLGEELWSKQRQIATAISQPRAVVSAPSCNSSGKTHLAGRLVWAFHDSFAPGTPCAICGGPCQGSIVITVSSKWDHLRTVLWGEIRRARQKARLESAHWLTEPYPKALRVESNDDTKWYIIGENSNEPESIQGHHNAHKLIVADEATALDAIRGGALDSMLASGDARLLVIFNPTDDTSYVASLSRASTTSLHRITAYDTPIVGRMTRDEIIARWPGARPSPHHRPSVEPIPTGATLINPEWLDHLYATGRGPGSLEWTTRVEADFWSSGADSLITREWVGQGRARLPRTNAGRVMAVDLAPYGTAENVIAMKVGDTIKLPLRVIPGTLPGPLFREHVTPALIAERPDVFIYDADGVGSGVGTDVEMMLAAWRVAYPGQAEPLVLPFRGAVHLKAAYTNLRSMSWWRLRTLLSGNLLSLNGPPDEELDLQLTILKYKMADGRIRVETKDELKTRLPGQHLDRADAVMMAAHYEFDTPRISVPPNQSASEEAMWQRRLDQLGDRRKGRGGAEHEILGEQW